MNERTDYLLSEILLCHKTKDLQALIYRQCGFGQVLKMHSRCTGVFWQLKKPKHKLLRLFYKAMFDSPAKRWFWPKKNAIPAK
jgi:hypothetical protein